MELAPGFAYNPDPSPRPTPGPEPAPAINLGLLAGLAGRWTGKGFNTIWRPDQPSNGQDRFLELNVTDETLEFTAIGGNIPNRGLLQADIEMGGLWYLQQISDANVAAPGNGLHIEPGVWLNIPPTTNPAESASVARLASIPHGTTILAQGVASQAVGPPIISPININPFPIGNPGAASPFPEQNLATQTNFRTPNLAAAGIEQNMVDDPNALLQAGLAGKSVTSTVTLHVSTTDLPVAGGGTLGTAFLVGGAAGPNAGVAQVASTFWIETLAGDPSTFQLQYSQLVLLNFNGLSWPHVTVATLERQAAVS
jgi:hypothetical protein